MKIRNVALAIIVIGLSDAVIAQDGIINTDKSSVEWLGKKIGGQHEGSIQLKSGSLEVKDNEIISGGFVVDMTTITNSDLENEGYNQKLVGHLKSDDFFGVKKYPTAEFVIKNSTTFTNGKSSVNGNMTIKGITERLTFDLVKDGNTYEATVDIDRSKFDVRYGSTSFFDNLGDKVIDDIFTLSIKLVVN